MKLLDKIESHARASDRHIAYREVAGQKREMSYADLWQTAHSLAAHLQSKIEQGGIVMICLPNRIEYPVAFLAILLAGASVFPVSPESTEFELQSLARQTKAAAIIGTPRACAAVKNNVPVSIDIGEVLNFTQPPAHHDIPPGDLLLCSSGTTSQPKIVIRDADSLDAVARATSNAIGFLPADRVLAIVPLCHSYGVEHGLLAPLWAGSTVHLCDGLNIADLTAQLAQSQITLFPGVPTVYEMICQIADTKPFKHLRKAYAAGAPLPETIAQTFLEKYRILITQLYGATEIGSVTYANPDAEHFDPRSVGEPFEGVSIRIINPDTQAPQSAHEEGEVYIAAQSMFKGYLHEAAHSTIDGYFPTGDLGRLDNFGNLTITGRLKLLIEVGGQKVNVLELENLLAQHPSVAQAVVVPLRVSQTVSRLKAVVTAADAANPPQPQQLKDFLRQRVSTYKIPRIIEVRATLPRSPAGKILRRMLEES
jgi:long-chain acyl-CoA synthetase